MSLVFVFVLVCLFVLLRKMDTKETDKMKRRKVLVGGLFPKLYKTEV